MVEKPAHPLLRQRTTGLSPARARQLDEAAAALGREQPAAAVAILDRTLAADPDCVEARRLLGVAQQLAGEPAQAVANLRLAVAARPDDALAQMNLGIALQSTGASEEALASLRRACALAPDFAPGWFNYARLLLVLGRPAGAVTALHRALDHEPEHVAARLLLAEAQAGLGAIPQAAENYRQALHDKPASVEAWTGLCNLAGQHFDAGDVARLQQALQSALPTPAARIALSFVLARALEDQGDRHAAFRALRKANAQMRRRLHWNAAAEHARAEAIRASFAVPPAVAAAPTPSRVLFVVGLPCAGATLAARSLAAHAQVGGGDGRPDLRLVIEDESRRRGQPLSQWADAATPQDWARLGRDYLERSAARRGGKPWLVDACLPNWLLLGAALAMLPDARVVDVRRDALETCFDCYSQLFAEGNEFSYDLDDLAGYWHDYDRLGRHWRALWPAQVLALDGGALLAAPREPMQRLLAFCGLADDPACLASLQAERVGREDVARGASYGRELNRLRLLLGRA